MIVGCFYKRFIRNKLIILKKSPVISTVCGDFPLNNIIRVNALYASSLTIVRDRSKIADRIYMQIISCTSVLEPLVSAGFL